MTTTRIPRNRVPMCPGCGLYPHTHNWAHRADCAVQQIPEHVALANIAIVFSPHLTPQSAAELQRMSANHGGEKGMAQFSDDAPGRFVAALRGIPKLPEAACRGRPELFGGTSATCSCTA